MRGKIPISVTVITFNEEATLPWALASVWWAQEIIVVDSGSTDRTVALAQKAGARVFSQPWQGYGAQKNFAHRQTTQPWVLNLDADERVSEELAEELQGLMSRLVSGGDFLEDGFYFPRKTFYLGRWIRFGGWYPNYQLRLARREKACWKEPVLHEVLQVKGKVGYCSGALLHDSFQTMPGQIETNLKFATLGCRALQEQGKRPSYGKLFLKPGGKFLETYFWKQGWRDGFPGFLIAVNAAYSVFLKYAFLWESRLQSHELEQEQAFLKPFLRLP